MLARTSARAALALALLVIAACPSGDDPAIEPTFENVYSEVLAPSCSFATCHSSSTKAARLELTQEAACRELVNKASCLFPNRIRVIPGHPEDSFFFHKLTGQGLDELPTSNCSGETNQRMPISSSALPDRHLTLIREWIAQGAVCDPGPDPMPMPTGPSPIATLTASRMAPLPGEVIAFNVTLERPAPTGGQIIRIIPHPALFMPSQIFVEAGATTTRFDAFAAKPTSRFNLRLETGTNLFKELPVRIAGLSVAEVLVDPVGVDTTRQWIKIRNTSTITINLTGYRLSAGQTSYGLTQIPLSGDLGAGACLVVGGPASGPENGDPVLGLAMDFSPDLPNVGNQGRGFAVTDGGTSPIDALLAGADNNAMLPGPDGDVPSPFCSVGAEGQSIKRTGPLTCAASSMTPNLCP